MGIPGLAMILKALVFASLVCACSACICWTGQEVWCQNPVDPVTDPTPKPTNTTDKPTTTKKPTTTTKKPTTTTKKTTTTKPPPANTCKCGKANTVQRIVGGTETKKNEYPWQVLLKKDGRFSCGGSLISNQAVLTAAHCLTTSTARRYKVQLGVHDMNNKEAHELELEPSKVIKHPEYNSYTQDNDVAIIILKEPVVFTHYYSAVCLPTKGSSYYGRDAIVSGWGTTYFGSKKPSDRLQDAEVGTMTNAQCCNGKDGKYKCYELKKSMLCAAAPGKDACQGDSGGPLTTKQGGNHVLIGVVSWGYGCAEKNYPGVYARTESQLDWIEKILSTYTQASDSNLESKICQKSSGADNGRVFGV